MVTTGTAFKAVDHWHPEIAAHIGASCILVHEAGQQAPELLSVSAVAMTRVPCLVIFVGDGNPLGGIKDSKLAQHLRRELMRLPIGLRADKRAVHQLTSALHLQELQHSGRALM